MEAKCQSLILLTNLSFLSRTLILSLSRARDITSHFFTELKIYHHSLFIKSKVILRENVEICQKSIRALYLRHT